MHQLTGITCNCVLLAMRIRIVAFVEHDVNGFGTDLLLGTLPPPAAPPVALLLAATFTGETGGVFLGILVVAPPDPTFFVGDSPTGCCVFSSTPLSWSPSVNLKFMKISLEVMGFIFDTSHYFFGCFF